MSRFVVALLLFASVAAADVTSGTRVRVTLLARPDAPLTGSLLAFRADSLALAVDPDSATRSFPRSQIALLERSTGMHSNAAKGALIGALVGGVGAGLLGVLFANAIKEGDTEAIPVVLGLGGAVGGALIGAGIGEGSKHESWEKVGP